MIPGVTLMYVEGEVRDGFLTGRTVLVIETIFELDENTAGYSHSTIKTMVDTARGEWAKRFCLPDLLRVVRAEGVQTVESGPRKIAS